MLPTSDSGVSDDAEPRESSGAKSVTTPQVPKFATDRGIGAWLVGTSLVAMIATFILLYERIQLWQDSSYSTSCDISPWVSCGTVMESWQASTFGFPNILIGVVGFPLLFAMAWMVLAGIKQPRWWWLGMQIGVTFAFGFCIWLWSQALYSINALCPYCMVVWAAVIPTFVVVTTRNIIHGIIPSSEGLKKLAADWWWVAIAVLYLVVIATIVIEFPQAFGL